ncbi:acyltransferase family protein [Phenylobacterium sp. VNQ135]|uniref:acyltransferase family protein n=1 Tax=Phenylobacterium sp. VNQ135 TaxID=3400922 RepID=UPI003C07B413
MSLTATAPVPAAITAPERDVRSADVNAPARVRRADLDWIRVGAFGLLILFHVALVYAPYDWHIRSVHRFEWIREAILLTGPWRLTLLFLVAGSALRLMAGRRTTAEVASGRLARLMPPLLFGIVALVPLQSWIEAVDKGYWEAGLLPWMASEFSPAGLANGVPVNHLWFLVYLTAYTLAILPLMARPDLMERAGDALERALSGWRVLWVPAAYLVVIRLALFPFFGVTNKLSLDWYNHALSLGAFAFGFLVVNREAIWRELELRRRPFLALSVCSLSLVMIQAWHPGGGAFFDVPRNAVFGVAQWMTIAAILGFGSRYLRHVNPPVLRYLNDGIFPCYLAHQTILVAAVFLLKPAGLPAVAEALILTSVTFGGSLLVYELVRRIPVMRPLWGLKPLDGAARRADAGQALLKVGIAAPIFAASAVLAATLAYPGFNHARQYLSELGGATAPQPLIFNLGVLAAGLMAGLAGIGFGLAIQRLTGARYAGALVAIVFLLAGYGLMAAAIYPWPDPRHLAINLALGIQLAPLLLLWSLRSERDMPGLKWFLGAAFVAMGLLTVITKHLVMPGLVNDANVGWWERTYAVILVGWVAVAAWLLDRRLKTASTAQTAAA